MCFFKKRRARKEAKRQAKLEEQKAVETKKEPIKEEVKPVEKAVVKEEVKTTSTKEPVKKEAEKAAKYHVSQNKDEKSPNFKQWRVRKEGSQKTIKFFETQAEAIEFAEELANKAGSSVVIHKVDGSIRKQDYSKK
ncbi:MAG: DUF2188 domain-containing protein [Acholeplasma sp.]|nr:DUF2188 domain-containing protein [Acholeplasma sp.]